jgi:DNA-binding PadR family transcriptional regulator
MDSESARAKLPLRPVVFGILTVLRQTPLHGYGIMKRANEHVGHRAILGPGTLYRTLKELRADGLIAPAEGPDDTDARRRYYELTHLGEAVAEAETTRLGRLIKSGALVDQSAGSHNLRNRRGAAATGRTGRGDVAGAASYSH